MSNVIVADHMNTPYLDVSSDWRWTVAMRYGSEDRTCDYCHKFASQILILSWWAHRYFAVNGLRSNKVCPKCGQNASEMRVNDLKERGFTVTRYATPLAKHYINQ